MQQQKSIASAAAKLKWWQIGLIAVGVSFLGKLSGGNDNNQQHLYTKKLKQAPWAPPAWVFAPAWTINNFFLLMGLKKLTEYSGTDNKQRLLILQALIWMVFFSFNYVYFKKKSTVLAAVLTMSDAVFATASLIVANKTDKKVALNYLPLTIWTLFASTLAGYQAVKNPDELLGTPAIIK